MYFKISFFYYPQSDPEFVQWKKEITNAFDMAQQMLRKGPKMLATKGSSSDIMQHKSHPPLGQRNSNGGAH